MIIESKWKKIKALVLIVALFSISPQLCAQSEVYLMQGRNATKVEKNTILDFKKDLQKVISDNVLIITDRDKIPTDGIVFLLGTINSNK